jgi:hypothetical protein
VSLKKNLFVFSFLLSSIAIKAQDLKTFTGHIDTHFNLSSTHNLNDQGRKEAETNIAIFAQKRPLLIDYFSKLNAGDEQGAAGLLKQDSVLSKNSEFSISLVFLMLRMKELNMLYKPCIQLNDDSPDINIISCSIEQLNELLKEDREYVLECRYLGELIPGNDKAYELIAIR